MIWLAGTKTSFPSLQPTSDVTSTYSLNHQKESKKHTAPGIRWSSPTQLLVRRLVAYLGESGRDPELSTICGRMCWDGVSVVLIFADCLLTTTTSGDEWVSGAVCLRARSMASSAQFHYVQKGGPKDVLHFDNQAFAKTLIRTESCACAGVTHPFHFPARGIVHVSPRVTPKRRAT